MKISLGTHAQIASNTNQSETTRIGIPTVQKPHELGTMTIMYTFKDIKLPYVLWKLSFSFHTFYGMNTRLLFIYTMKLVKKIRFQYKNALQIQRQIPKPRTLMSDPKKANN